MNYSTRDLAEAFCRIDKPPAMSKFFTEIFTPAEIDDFVLRWRLMEMLLEGVPQREIASELGISLCKITRGSRLLKKKNTVTEKILKDKIGDT
ncbi:MAG: Trp family transcriptional regulator [Candidatus Krumholzibacteriales bacterium]